MRENGLKIFTLFFAVFMLHMNIYAQISVKEQEQAANATVMMQNGNYYQAAQIFESILKTDPKQTAIAYKYAICSQRLLNYQDAEQWFRNVQLLDSTNEYPEASFYLGMAEKNNGKYDQAIQDFQKYLEIGKTPNKITQAKNEIASCRFALSHQNDSTTIEIEHLPAPINTEYSEFNPVPISSSELVFSRYQNVFKDTFESIFDQSYISDIMTTKISEQGYSTPNIYSKRLQGKNDFTANICFNHNFRKAYFTVCEDLDGIVGNCAIYYSEYKNGKWKKPKRLSNDINVEGYSSTQPFLVRVKDFEILYFSSNRPGGMGGMDIWYVIIKDGHYQQVTNLGSIINTKGSEVTPTYDAHNQLLYFSSDWHQGFGGFDIFSSQGGLNSWTTPKNIGMPINSSSNDYYYISKPKTQEAWFSSNRLESFHRKDAENCCSDIYYVSFEPKEEEPELDTLPPPVSQLDSIEKKIQKLLPLTLYFHNDIPDPRSVKPTTDKNYEDLLADYFKLKEKYKKEYSRGLKGEQAEQAAQDVEDFFDNYVGHGFEDLEKLAALLKRELEQGKNIRLKIKGYASPLNTSDYNLNLSKRRIGSLVNYLKSYDNGYFVPYFEGTAPNGGSISIFEDPLGDTQSRDFVSDNPNDKRNSVYSRAAAMERKIQIILYSSGNTLDEDVSNKEFPQLQWKTTQLNPDSIKQGQRGVYRLEFSNIGKSELQITSISSSAAYFSTQLKQNLFQPNDQGTLYLLIQTENLNPGDYHFDLKIKSNMLEKEVVVEFEFRVY